MKIMSSPWSYWFLFPACLALFTAGIPRVEQEDNLTLLSGSSVKFWDLNPYYGWRFERNFVLTEYTRDANGKREIMDPENLIQSHYIWSIQQDSLFYGPEMNPRHYVMKILKLTNDSLVVSEDNKHVRRFFRSPIQH
jgi:hypothetical protein